MGIIGRASARNEIVESIVVHLVITGLVVTFFVVLILAFVIKDLFGQRGESTLVSDQ